MPNKSRIAPPPSELESLFSFEWVKWFSSISDLLGVSPLKIQSFSVSDLTTVTELSPANWGSITPPDQFSSLVFVHDEAGGATLAFSDGTNWLRVQDRVVIS